MIDIENYVINRVKKAIENEDQKVRIYSSHVRTPSEFPCIMIYESGNATYEPTRTADGTEVHAEVRYTIEVCTNDKQGKKENAKRISMKVDEAMQAMGFYRASRQYSFGTNESTIVVALMTYRGLVGESLSGNENEFTIYRR